MGNWTDPDGNGKFYFSWAGLNDFVISDEEDYITKIMIKIDEISWWMIMCEFETKQKKCAILLFSKNLIDIFRII